MICTCRKNDLKKLTLYMYNYKCTVSSYMYQFVSLSTLTTVNLQNHSTNQHITLELKTFNSFFKIHNFLLFFFFFFKLFLLFLLFFGFFFFLFYILFSFPSIRQIKCASGTICCYNKFKTTEFANNTIIYI